VRQSAARRKNQDHREKEGFVSGHDFSRADQRLFFLLSRLERPALPRRLKLTFNIEHSGQLNSLLKTLRTRVLSAAEADSGRKIDGLRHD